MPPLVLKTLLIIASKNGLAQQPLRQNLLIDVLFFKQASPGAKMALRIEIDILMLCKTCLLDLCR
jgi:hypothetical protein